VLASSTPDALWRAPALRVLRPATVACRSVTSGRLLDRCSLSLAAGTRVLVVGEPPEAASLLVRILAGLVRPRRGTVSVAGVEGPASTAGARLAAYVGRSPAFAPWMTPREVLGLAASLLGMDRDSARRPTEGVIAHARIPASLLDDPLSSHGPDIAERTDLAAALLGDPEVLLLDDPLRSIGAAERTELLRFEGERRTLVLTSHVPERETGLVTHGALLRTGQVVLVAPIADFRTRGATSAHVPGADAGEPPGTEATPAQAARSGRAR
jgi:ABC-2 type transport system ATP-binding protein